MSRGFALLSVLWTVGLLSAVAAVLLRTVHADLTQARTDIALARAQAAADGEARLAILKALGNPLLPWDGQARGGVIFQDEGGLVDLNSAAPAVLATLLPTPKVAAILAARGPETAPTPFYSTLDLARVPGFDAALVHRLQPLLTVHSGQPGLDPKTAPVVLAADKLPERVRTESRHSAVRISAQAAVDGVIAWRTADVHLTRQGGVPYRVLTWIPEGPV